MVANTWVHLVATFSSDADADTGALLQLYVDGVLQNATANVQFDAVYTMTNNWLIGTERRNDRYFQGDLDDLRIYDSELSAGEVAALFDAGPLFVPPEDSDGDGLRDEFENSFGLDANIPTGDNGAQGDPDGDMLENIDEQTRGTDPTKADTDGDMLTDLVETNTGFYQDASNTGTDPNNPDTDGDTLNDNVEKNSGIFSGAGDTGTNPFVADTDGDGLSDGVETNSGTFSSLTDTGTDPTKGDTDGGGVMDQTEIVLGSDPFNSDDDPTEFSKILFIGGGDTAVNGGDAAVFSDLIGNFGIDAVEYADSKVLEADAEAEFDLVVISSTVRSDAVRGRFQNSVLPIVNWEQSITDNGTPGELQLSAPLVDVGLQVNLSITEVSHPITEALTGTTIALVNNEAQVYSVDSATLASGVLSLGETNGQASLFVAEAGAQLLGDGSEGAPAVAPARRVHLPFVDNTYNFITEDGRTLFIRSIQWALGSAVSEPQPAFIPVEVVNYDENTGEISLTWESENGKNYNVQSSSNLVDWTVVNTAPIVAAGVATSASFTQDPSATPALFYRVIELANSQ